ncbi:class I SAM-dependent methyltransferase [Candidatus Peregrinibacteria bacterium]|nr:class I SAM-dependent methyltransferase [Candidatus Peregrinibacteria bacterium]
MILTKTTTISSVSSTTVHLEEYQNDNVKKTFDPDCMPIILQDAVEKEWQFLNALPWEGKTILDIGVGQGRHALKYAPQSEKYIGVDIAEDMINTTRKSAEKHGIQNIYLIHSDAEFLDDVPGDSVDRVLCMYFTAGNFRKDNFNVAKYEKGEITKNEKFIAILRHMYRILKKGSIYLTVYKQCTATKNMQFEFYSKTGQHILNAHTNDPFMATKEGFWSLRFTKELMLGNLAHVGIRPDQVVFHDLNEISWIVEISKQ